MNDQNAGECQQTPAQIPTPNAIPPAKAHRPAPRRNRAAPLLRIRAKRLALQELMARARLLPPKPRAILRDYFERKAPTSELAFLHGIPARQMRGRIRRWKGMLSDPDFLLAASFGPQLPRPLAEFAAAYWLEGHSLRRIAAEQNSTLHGIRARLAETRLQLVRASALATLKL